MLVWSRPMGIGCTHGLRPSRRNSIRSIYSTARRITRPSRPADPLAYGSSAGRLFGDLDAGAAEFFGEILELGQGVPQMQHHLPVVHVQARLERQVRKDGGVHVREPERRMLREDVTAAG